MSRPSWSIQDAKNRFSAVVEAARKEPQLVTKHGRPAVVIVDAEEYGRLARFDQVRQPRFNDHLLALPSDDGTFDPLSGELRTAGL